MFASILILVSLTPSRVKCSVVLADHVSKNIRLYIVMRGCRLGVWNIKYPLLRTYKMSVLMVRNLIKESVLYCLWSLELFARRFTTAMLGAQIALVADSQQQPSSFDTSFVSNSPEEI